jgi:hypothetical protein
MFTWDWSHQLAFPLILLQIYDDETSKKACQELGKHWDSSWWTQGTVDLIQEVPNGHAIPVRNTAINGGRRWWSWAPGSRARRAVHDDHRLQFHRGLKNSATMFQAVVRQLATTNLIDGPAWPPIRTPSMTTRSSGLALSEIQATKPKNQHDQA